MGEVKKEFDPPIVMVPNDWNRLWSEEEKNKLSLRDREIYEEELQKIMHVQFLKNSDEQAQKYFTANLTSFTQYELRINLNFSDPILVS